MIFTTRRQIRTEGLIKGLLPTEMKKAFKFTAKSIKGRINSIESNHYLLDADFTPASGFTGLETVR